MNNFYCKFLDFRHSCFGQITIFNVDIKKKTSDLVIHSLSQKAAVCG